MIARTSWQKLEDDVVLSVRLTKGWRPTAARYGLSVSKVKRIVKNNARREREARESRRRPAPPASRTVSNLRPVSPGPFRLAAVFGLDVTEERVARYLPSNYEVLDSDVVGSQCDSVLIGGRDSAGWTMEGYVIPRLASGGMFATEEADDQ
jgi:hypothetical protein